MKSPSNDEGLFNMSRQHPVLTNFPSEKFSSKVSIQSQKESVTSVTTSLQPQQETQLKTKASLKPQKGALLVAWK